MSKKESPKSVAGQDNFIKSFAIAISNSTDVPTLKQTEVKRLLDILGDVIYKYISVGECVTFIPGKIKINRYAIGSKKAARRNNIATGVVELMPPTPAKWTLEAKFLPNGLAQINAMTKDNPDNFTTEAKKRHAMKGKKKR